MSSNSLYRFILSLLLCFICGVLASQPSQKVSYFIKEAPDGFITYKDVTLHYKDLGRGEPIVLLHGYSVNLDWWGSLADSLALTHRVIALDQRGFGQSSKFSDSAQYDTEMVDDIARLLKELHLPRVHLIGHSMGALLAANFALKYPKQTATISLVAGPFYADVATMHQTFGPHLKSLEKGEGLKSLYSWLLPMLDSATISSANERIMAQNDAGALKAVLKNFNSYVISPSKARQGRIPALVIVGGADPMKETSHRLASLWPRARMLDLPGANHIDIVFRPQFLAEVRRHIPTQ